MADEKKRAPAFPWYPRDFDMDEAVKLMTYEEEGIYRRLLDHQWFHDGLPEDIDLVARLVPKVALPRFRKLWPAMAAKFESVGGRLVNPKLERVRAEKAAYQASRAASGELGGLAKANNAKRRERLAAARAIATHTQQDWLEMLTFFGGRCVKCGNDSKIDKDHIVPLYVEGSHDGITNIQPLCSACNAAKGPDSTDYRTAGGRKIPGKWLVESLAPRLATG